MTLDAKFSFTLAAFLFACYSYSTWAAGRMSADNSAVAGKAPHEPSVADVLVTKAMLNKALALPPEIVDTIVDLAEYWPHTTTELNDSTLIARGNSASASIRRDRPNRENIFLLRSPPLGLHNWKRVSRGTDDPPVHKTVLKPQPPGDEFSASDFQEFIACPISLLAHPCRRIIFTIRSHDQGFGGDLGAQGTHNSSWTWFEAGLERWCKTSPAQTSPAGPPPQQEQHPSLTLDSLCTVYPEVKWDAAAENYAFEHPLHAREDLKVQCNVVAEREAQEYRVAWSYTDDVDPERDVEAGVKLAQQGRGKATGNGKFVRDLRLGDVVTLWAKARFPSWANFIESAKVEVYYAV